MQGTVPTKVIAVVAVLVLMGLGTGCGDKEISQSDLSTVQAILNASAEIDRAMQPLYSCLPEDAACFRRSGPQAVRVAERERRRVTPTLAVTKNSCLDDAGRLFGKSLDGYARAAHAAARGKSSRFDAAISQTTRHEIAYVRKLNDCGFTQGRLAEIGAAVRMVDVAMLRLNDEIVDCKSLKCVNRVAHEMEKQAGIGVARLDEFLAELDEDAPSCIRGALVETRATFVSVRRGAVALQEGRYTAAEKQGNRSIEQGAATKQHMAACLESLGTG
jgi:hypothetical protein